MPAPDSAAGAVTDHWPETERQIRDRVGHQGFSNLVGAVLEALAPGECSISVARRPELLQQHGFLHGGCVAFLVDNATTVAAATLLRPGQTVLTAEYKLNFLAPCRGETVICRARIIKPGRTMSIVTADVFSVEGGVERHAATALATIAVVSLPK
jgi:uncharacterized protein (TIGR00369 family)